MNIFITALQLILVILKGTGYIDVSWIIVFLPTIFLLVILSVCSLIWIVHTRKVDRRIKREIYKSLEERLNDKTESDSYN